MKQKYITVPLAIAYWVLIPTETFDADAWGGYIILGSLLTWGTLTDLGK